MSLLESSRGWTRDEISALTISDSVDHLIVGISKKSKVWVQLTSRAGNGY